MYCKYGDPTCPCQDGDRDLCHYVRHGDTPAMNVPPEYVRNAVLGQIEACATISEILFIKNNLISNEIRKWGRNWE